MDRSSTPMVNLADQAAEVAVSPPVLLAKGYRDYERYRLTLKRADEAPLLQTRDLLRGGRVAAVLPIDPARGEIVLIRQFRLPTHLANGKGDMVEIVAGRVEAGENPVQAARRECREEIGVGPLALLELLTFLPTPGLTDEEIILFLGVVDAAALPERAGAADEHEHIRPMRIKIDDALAALAGGAMRNGNLIIALQWLALNRPRLDQWIRLAMAANK